MSSPRLTGKISVKRPFIDYVTIIESAPFLKKSWGEWSCSLWKTVVKKRDRETQILKFTTLLKKRLSHSCFSVDFSKFSRKPYLLEYFRWLLLKHLFWSTLVKSCFWLVHYSTCFSFCIKISNIKHFFSSKINSKEYLSPTFEHHQT